MAFLNPWFILAVIVAAAGLWTHGYTSNDGAEKVQAQWDHANGVAMQARQARIDETRASQDRLQAAADDSRRKTNEANKRRDARLADALDRLRNRPERPAVNGRADVPQPASPGAEGGGCTGAGLFRDDAAFLTRHSDLTQRVRNQRDACYSQYERAQAEIDRLNASKAKK